MVVFGERLSATQAGGVIPVVAAMVLLAREHQHAGTRPRARQIPAAAAVLAGLGTAVLALLGLPHLFREATLGSVVASGSPVPSPAEDGFARSVAALTGTPLTAGHGIDLLSHGDESFRRLFEDLGAARRSITMQMYYKSGGLVADSVERILMQRARAGVEVYFLHDAIGADALPGRYADSLRAAGVRVATFRPFRWYQLDRLGHRAHTRAIVLDGMVGYTGGFGLDDKWLGDGRHPGSWRDTNVRFTGPASAQLQGVFAQEWSEATGELLAGDALFPPISSPTGAVAGLLYSVPTVAPSAAERLLVLSIAGAQRSLYIANAYFVPNRAARRLLAGAARRGVDVRILTNGAQIDFGVTRLAGRASYEELLQAGVRVFEYEPAMMHAKNFVVDGLWSSVGTVNFDNRSLALNNESTLLVLDRSFGAAMDSVFREDLRFSREVRLSSFRRRPWTERVLERAARLLGRVL
jgi:cardiolipin synthase